MILLSLVFLSLGLASAFGMFFLEGSASESLMSLGSACFLLYALLSLIGKGLCTSSPVSKELIQASLFLEALSLGLGLCGVMFGLRALSGLLAIALFLAFTREIAAQVKEERASRSAWNSLKFFGLSIAVAALGVALVFVSPNLLVPIGLFLASSLSFSVYSYSRTLILLRNAIANLDEERCEL